MANEILEASDQGDGVEEAPEATAEAEISEDDLAVVEDQSARLQGRLKKANAPVPDLEFREHPLDNPKAVIGEDPDKGKGVYAKEKVNPGEIVAAFDPRCGKVFHADSLQGLGYPWLIDHVIQTGERDYLLHRGLAEHLNHSCEPNCGLIDGERVPSLIEGAVGIITMREIQAGEELCWDYAMSEDSDWEMEGCKCGSPRCRGTITANRDLPEDVKREYEPYTLKWIKEQGTGDLDQEEGLRMRPKIETLKSPIDESVIREVTAFFRETFSNDWPTYAVCQDCDSTRPGGMRLSAPDVYDTGGRRVPIEVLDHLPIIPDCPCCGEQMEMFMDAQRTFEKLDAKLNRDGFLALLRDPNTNEILGLTFGHICTLKEAFDMEEWGHPYSYSAAPDPKHYQDFDPFCARIRERLAEVGYSGPSVEGPDTDVFLSNCAITHPKIRGLGFLPFFLQGFVNSIPDEIKDRYATLGEVENGSKFHHVMLDAGQIGVGGVLAEGYSIVIGSLRRISDRLNLPPSEFKRRPRS